MNEKMPLSFAVQRGIRQINRRGVVFNPSIGRLITDLRLSPGLSGVIALPSDKSHQGYSLVKLSAPEVPSLEITVNDIWSCAKEHYGLTAAAVAAGVGSVPISKILLGHPVLWGSSKYVNLTSHLGHKFFPMATLSHRSTAARVAKSTFGTIRIFGIVGRTVPFVAIGLAVYDAISIGMCAYEERNGK